MLFLQANTAVDVLIGPFVDDADGKTPETALTLSQADIKLSKNGQALAQKNDTTAAAHDADGYYNCELDATDTNTEGTLVLTVSEAGALLVRHEFMVLSQAAYASLVAAKDSGVMDVHVASMGANVLTAAAINADAITAAKVAADVTTEIQSGLATASALATVAGYVDTEVAAIKAKTDNLPSAAPGAAGGLFIAGANAATSIASALTAHITGNVSGSVGGIASGGLTAASLDATIQARLGIIAAGTAQAATGTTLQLASSAAFADDELIGAVVVITGGSAGVGQSRVITDHVGSTDTVTVDAWTTTPTGTITYVIFAAPPASATAIPSVNVAQINGATITGDGDGSPFDVA